MVDPTPQKRSGSRPLDIAPETFRRIAKRYRTDWPVRLALVDALGRRRLGSGWWGGPDPQARRELMAFVIQEGLRWGEPTITYAPGGDMFWAVPVMRNAKVLGGLVAAIHEDVLFPGPTNRPIVDLRRGCTVLRQLAEHRNLTNAALLEARRWEYKREQNRAETLQALRDGGVIGVRQLYLRDEPRLMAALRQGDRPQARGVLNQMLTTLFNAAGERFGLIHSFCIELVATMGRTAVEAGGDVDRLLGAGYQDFGKLASVTSLDELAPVLHEALDRIMDSMAQHRDTMEAMVMANAVQYMRDHLAQDLGRDQVAEAMCMSGSHFSRLFKAQVGKPFGETLARMRIDQAAELLARTDLGIGEIAKRCGFPDASAFGKTFRKFRNQTPKGYRAQRDRASAEGE